MLGQDWPRVFQYNLLNFLTSHIIERASIFIAQENENVYMRNYLANDYGFLLLQDKIRP